MLTKELMKIEENDMRMFLDITSKDQKKLCPKP